MAHVVAMLQGEVESKRVENELNLGKSIIKSIKTSFSAIRSTIEISCTLEGLESSSQLLSNDSNISVNQNHWIDLAWSLTLYQVHNAITTHK